MATLLVGVGLVAMCIVAIALALFARALYVFSVSRAIVRVSNISDTSAEEAARSIAVVLGTGSDEPGAPPSIALRAHSSALAEPDLAPVATLVRRAIGDWRWPTSRPR